jgi:hypothetical protein
LDDLLEVKIFCLCGFKLLAKNNFCCIFESNFMKNRETLT